MKGFQNQVLSFKDGLKQIIGIYHENGKPGKYCLYLRTLKADGKWSCARIIGVYDDFYKLLYMAGEHARMQNMFEV